MDGQSAQFRLHIPGHCANALLVPRAHQSMRSHVVVCLNRLLSPTCPALDPTAAKEECMQNSPEIVLSR